MENFISSPIDDYKFALFGRSTDCGDLMAFIFCYYHGKCVLICEFYRDGCELPENRMSEDQIVITYPEIQFRNVIDILRNEKPLYFGFNHSTKVGYLSTQQETPGKHLISHKLVRFK